MAQHRFTWGLFGIVLLLSCSGCELIGIVGSKVVPPPKIKAAYTGLQNQSVGVMVWADRGLRIDYPSMPLDVATLIQNKLQAAQKEGEADDLKGTTFPVKPASIVRYQMDNPQVESLPLTDVAPHLGVSRLIYIEIQDFSSRPQPSVELFRGKMSGNIKLVEITKDRKATIPYKDDGVKAEFPKKAPPDGVVGSDDYRIYAGTADEFANEVVRRFVEHEDEEK